MDAEMNTRYWGYLTARYHNRDVRLKIFVAICASGTVAGWTVWASFPMIWQVLSGLSAVTAIALPIINYSERVRAMADLRGKWSRTASEYRRLWTEMEDNPTAPTESIKERLASLDKEQEQMSQDEARISLDEKLRWRCFEEVKRANGLS